MARSVGCSAPCFGQVSGIRRCISSTHALVRSAMPASQLKSSIKRNQSSTQSSDFRTQLMSVAVRLGLTLCIVLAGQISASAQAPEETQANQYFLGNDITLKFNGYAELGLEYITPRLEGDASSFRFSAYAEHETKLTFQKNWSLNSVVKSQQLDKRDDDNDGEGYGVTLDSLYLQYGTSRYKVYAGKFQARFGLAQHANLGKFGYDFNDYKVDEKLGFGGSVGFGDPASGSYVLSASLFTADTTIFSDSLFFQRDRLRRSDGGPSNTGDLSSFAIALDGDRTPWTNGVKYHVAYAHLAAGNGDQSASDSVVFGLRNDGLNLADDMRLEWVGEVAYVTNADGDGDDVTSFTLGTAIYKGRYTLTSVYAPRLVSAQNAADDRTDQLFALSVGYAVTDNSQAILSYRYRDEDDTTDNTVSLSYGFSY